MTKDKLMFTLSVCSNAVAFIILIYTWVPGLYNAFDTVFSIFVDKKMLAIAVICIFAAFSLISGLYYFKTGTKSKLKTIAIINSLLTMLIIMVFGMIGISAGSALGEVPPWRQLSIMNAGWIFLFVSILLTAANVFLSAQFIKKSKSFLK